MIHLCCDDIEILTARFVSFYNALDIFVTESNLSMKHYHADNFILVCESETQIHTKLIENIYG